MWKLLIGVGLGFWLARQGADRPSWWVDVMTRAFASDQVTVRRDAVADAASQAAADSGIPVAWLVSVAEQGVADLQAAARKMAETAKNIGAPADSLPGTLAAWKAAVIGSVAPGPK